MKAEEERKFKEKTYNKIIELQESFSIEKPKVCPLELPPPKPTFFKDQTPSKSGSNLMNESEKDS
jgi:hypothetical protein